jgi:transcriptional regulator GlxA family with amidase domain
LGTRTTSNIIPVEAYIKKVFPNLRYVITICTGSALLARTRILDGRRATSNKWAWAWVTSQGPKVQWVPKARWVIDEQPGKIPIWTSSGVTAGLDTTFAFVKKWYGDALEEQTAGIFEYERHTDASYDPFSKMWNVPGAF